MITALLAGLAGYSLMSNPRRRVKRRRRNPETFKWKISPAVLAELVNNEVDNDPDQNRDGAGLEMATAIENSKGSLVLSRAASVMLRDALDNMEDISNDGGYRALARAAGKLRDKISAELNATKSNPHLGNKGDEFKKHASLRILQDAIEKETGKRLSLAQVEEFLVTAGRAAYRSAAMKAFRVIEGKHRANPLSLDALAMPVAGIFWRKHGYQAAGHAEDLAMMARRGTTAAKLWARVAQITKAWLYAGKKRSNPGGERKKLFFNDSTKIPPELLRQLQTVKPDHESDDQTNWTLVWDGWEWKATGCSTIATRDKPNLCDLTLEPIWEHTSKKPRRRR